tara:strand:+ start:42 stop:245 length:204 start_codon:yes stop_codon:yes gene_type:complete
VFLFGQESLADRPNPCEDPLLNLAQHKGIKAIPIKDIPRFRKLMKACERGRPQVHRKDCLSGLATRL